MNAKIQRGKEEGKEYQLRRGREITTSISLISGQIRGRPWTPDTRCDCFSLVKCHLSQKEIKDWKIKKTAEWKCKELAELREMRFASEGGEPVTRRGMRLLPVGVCTAYPLSSSILIDYSPVPAQQVLG